jgi:diphthamide biosynthesis methyltransferase
MKAHSLILCDIGLDFQDAMDQLKTSAQNHDVSLKKIVVCQALGTKKKRILYGNFEDLKESRIHNPYCIIIPSKLHFLEKEMLEEFAKG